MILSNSPKFVDINIDYFSCYFKLIKNINRDVFSCCLDLVEHRSEDFFPNTELSTQHISS